MFDDEPKEVTMKEANMMVYLMVLFNGKPKSFEEMSRYFKFVSEEKSVNYKSDTDLGVNKTENDMRLCRPDEDLQVTGEKEINF